MKKVSDRVRIAASQGVPRVGKTARDRQSGYFARRMANRDARNEYIRKCVSEVNLSNLAFPYHACNGQRNRSRWTGKNNKAVFAKTRVHR